MFYIISFYTPYPCRKDSSTHQWNYNNISLDGLTVVQFYNLRFRFVGGDTKTKWFSKLMLARLETEIEAVGFDCHSLAHPQIGRSRPSYHYAVSDEWVKTRTLASINRIAQPDSAGPTTNERLIETETVPLPTKLSEPFTESVFVGKFLEIQKNVQPLGSEILKLGIIVTRGFTHHHDNVHPARRFQLKATFIII